MRQPSCSLEGISGKKKGGEREKRIEREIKK